jgi:hypothetical protein
MMGIGFPDNFDQYKSLASNGTSTGKGLVSDATLVIMSSSMNPLKQVTFKNIFPVDLSPITFDSRQTDVSYVEATATFALQKYEIIAA